MVLYRGKTTERDYTRFTSLQLRQMTEMEVHRRQLNVKVVRTCGKNISNGIFTMVTWTEKTKRQANNKVGNIDTRIRGK